MTEKQETTEERVVEEENLVDVLNEFNTGNEGSPPEEAKAEGAETAPEEDTPVSNEAEPEPTTQEAGEPPTVEEEARWLIDGKFRDDEEGKEKLAKSYREMQSLRDKDKASFEKEIDSYQPLRELDTFLKDTPEAVKALQGVVSTEQAALMPPEQPDDFDVLDVFSPGTSSNDWFNNTLDFREERGARRALDAISKIESDKGAIQELRDEGLSDEEIAEYNQFMRDPQNVTTKNTVATWRLLTKVDSSEQRGSEEPPTDTEVPAQNVNKRVAAAAVSGSVPPAKAPEEKDLEKLWGGIMEFSR